MSDKVKKNNPKASKNSYLDNNSYSKKSKKGDNELKEKYLFKFEQLCDELMSNTNSEFKKNKKINEEQQAEKSSIKIDDKSVLISNLKKVLFKIIFFFIFIYLFAFFIFGFYRVNGISMEPNINDGDLVLFYRLDKEYVPGDAIVINKDGKNMVVRVIALPGQSVSFDEEGVLFVNNHVDTNKTYFKNVIPNDSNISYPLIVDEGCLFVLGDYRTNTNDSRTFGCISKKDVKGKIIVVLKTKKI